MTPVTKYQLKNIQAINDFTQQSTNNVDALLKVFQKNQLNIFNISNDWPIFATNILFVWVVELDLAAIPAQAALVKADGKKYHFSC